VVAALDEMGFYEFRWKVRLVTLLVMGSTGGPFILVGPRIGKYVKERLWISGASVPWRDRGIMLGVRLVADSKTGLGAFCRSG